MKLSQLINNVSLYRVYDDYLKIIDKAESDELLATVNKTLEDIKALYRDELETGLYISLIPELAVEYNLTGDSYRIVMDEFKVCFYSPANNEEIPAAKQDWLVWANSKVLPHVLDSYSPEFIIAQVIYEMHMFGFDYETVQQTQVTYSYNIMDETPDDIYEEFFGYTKDQAPGKLINADPEVVEEASQKLKQETQNLKEEYYGGLE